MLFSVCFFWAFIIQTCLLPWHLLNGVDCAVAEMNTEELKQTGHDNGLSFWAPGEQKQATGKAVDHPESFVESVPQETIAR